MLPEFIKAKILIKNQRERFLRHAINLYIPGFLDQATFKAIYEGDSLVMEMPEGNRVEKDIDVLRSNSETYTLDQLKSKPAMVFEQLAEIAQAMGTQLGTHSVTTMMEIAQQHNPEPEGQHENGIEMIFNLWERMLWIFDDNGSPNEHTFMVNPASKQTLEALLIKIETEPALAARKKALIERKRQSWYDRKNNRELVG